ncbi:hypothetical protein B0H11DRAFT_1908510 [Mycena galericulata]|nr:hypothetical protein B0H11DRAFT_1908510 [Mycena galericulata]
MPSIARTILLALHASVFLALTALSPDTASAVAAPTHIGVDVRAPISISVSTQSIQNSVVTLTTLATDFESAVSDVAAFQAQVGEALTAFVAAVANLGAAVANSNIADIVDNFNAAASALQNIIQNITTLSPDFVAMLQNTIGPIEAATMDVTDASAAEIPSILSTLYGNLNSLLPVL